MDGGAKARGTAPATAMDLIHRFYPAGVALMCDALPDVFGAWAANNPHKLE